MRQFVGLIKSISIGSLSIFYILVGFLAAVTSAIIEYKVLEQFLTFGDGREAYYALIVVAVLEGAKYSLYFFIPGFEKEGNDLESKKRIKNILKTTKYILISISAFCSLVFFINCFYQNVPTDSELNDRIEERATAEKIAEKNEKEGDS